MVKSMTGFGRSEHITENCRFVVEVKAVNHRYCDVSIKLPKKLIFFENQIRTVLKEYASRGKIDLFVTYEDYSEATTCVRYNKGLAKQYYDEIESISREFGLEMSLSATTLSKYPEVLTLEEQSQDEKSLWPMLHKPLCDALEHFVSSRVQEGENLKNDLLMKLDKLVEFVNQIETRSPEIVANYRTRLMEKVHELLEDTKVSEAVLATEITVFADKICVDEETVRLKSHIENMKGCLAEGENVGRKLDFIAQEMNREANTILSKANDMVISDVAINLKTEIEKIREQIQNIE